MVAGSSAPPPAVQVVTVSVTAAAATNNSAPRQALQPVTVIANRIPIDAVATSVAKESLLAKHTSSSSSSSSSTSRRPPPPTTSNTSSSTSSILTSSSVSGGSVGVPPPPSKLAPKAPLTASSAISLNDSVIVNALTGQINALKADMITVIDYRLQAFTQRLDSIEKRLDEQNKMMPNAAGRSSTASAPTEGAE